jgi:hypothetical protein
MLSMHDKFYNDCIEAYKRVYDRLGIGEDTYVTFASGGAFHAVQPRVPDDL